MAHNLNVIGVCWLEFAVLGQSAPKKHNREKSPDTFVTHMKFLKHVSAMFDNQKILLLWQQNKQISHALAAWSASRALFTWSQCTTWAKVFYFTVIAHTSAKVRKKTIVWLLGAKIITYPLVLQNERLFPLGLSLLKINSTWFYSNNQITQLWFLQFNYQFLIIWLNEASLQLSVSSQKLHACSLVCYLTFWVMNTENKTYNPYQISLAVSQHFNFQISHKN